MQTLLRAQKCINDLHTKIYKASTLILKEYFIIYSPSCRSKPVWLSVLWKNTKWDVLQNVQAAFRHAVKWIVKVWKRTQKIIKLTNINALKIYIHALHAYVCIHNCSRFLQDTKCITQFNTLDLKSDMTCYKRFVFQINAVLLNFLFIIESWGKNEQWQ